MEAAAKLQAYEQMSSVERSSITKIPPLSSWNATLIVDPVLGKIISANLNYNLQKALIDFPFEGFVKTGQLLAPGALTLELNSGDLPLGAGYKSVPFFRFVISASPLNARPGGNYSISIKGTLQNGSVIITPIYTIQRRSSTEPIVGVMVPFALISTRTLPVLPMFGTDGVTPVKMEIIVDGMTTDEVLTVTIPGYATKEMREISEMYNLPAGLIL
jgi:hypothetical protein